MDTLLKSTTRHVRLFTARVEQGDLVPDANQLTLDLDP
ncbi:MAG: NAD(P)H-quinone oxidoreductase subunit M, partial [Cyanobium sp.]